MYTLNKKKGIIMMIFATLFWGVMGISSRFLNEINFGSMDIAFIRAFSAAILTTIFTFLTDRKSFKINFKGILFCSFYGILTFATGISLYSMSIARIPISVATILMFSNPIWVTFFNYVFFKEKISLKTCVIIGVCIFGCMCIIDIFSSSGENLDTIGIIAGICNGMTFALQIVLPKFVENKISKTTILLYGFWGATICLLFFVDINNMSVKIASSSNPIFFIANILYIGVLATFIANTFYIKSTQYIGTALPSMMVALEPVFASIIAFFIFGENMKQIQFLGAFIVIFSVIAMDIDLKYIQKFFRKYR